MDLLGNSQHSPRRKIFFENREDALAKLLNNLPLNFFLKEDCVVVGISFAGVYFAHKLELRTLRQNTKAKVRLYIPS